MAQRRDTGLRAFLDQSGVLEHGTDEQIRAVRKAYRKSYMQDYKRKQRKTNPEFLVQLSRADGTHAKISAAAKKHQQSVTTFLRLATLAYIDRSYLVPDRQLVGKLAGLLESCLNDVRAMASIKTKHSPFALEEKYELIEKRIAQLENEIRNLFFFPAILESAVAKAIRTDAALRDRLQIILSHAHRED